jgi:putative DNA primase/helicase
MRKTCKVLAFLWEQRLIQDDIVSSSVMFEGEHVSQSIDEALTASESRGAAARKTLSSSSQKSWRMVRWTFWRLEADDKRLSHNKAFRQARGALGITATGRFWSGARYVLSAQHTMCAQNTMRAPFQTGAHMDNSGANGEIGARE